MFLIEILAIALLRAAFFYGGILALVIGAILLLVRKTTLASRFIAVGMLPAFVYGVMWFMTYIGPASRAAEVAAFPRTVPSVAERPRTLIIRDHGLALRPYIYFLAETGFFDVFVIQGSDYSPKDRKVWRLDVAESDRCKETRKERDEMVMKTGWRACASAVRVDRAPSEGLILYTSSIDAPHSLFAKSKTVTGIEAPWTLEFGWRQGAGETLIAYDEFLAFPEMRFHSAIGPFTLPRDPPRQRGTIAAPEPARFVLLALGIDEELITPRPFVSADERRQLLEELTSSGQPDDTQRALDLIAAGIPEPVSRAAMTRLASNPVTSGQMRLKYQNRYCEKLEKLARFRVELVEACTNNAVPTDKCGLIAHPGQWLDNCADNSVPVWRRNDAPARRVFISDVLDGDPTPVALSRPARVIELRVPSDRGAIDLVLRNVDPTIFVFTGAVSCIARLTVLAHGDPAAGIAGISRKRVRFARPLGSGSWINPQAPYSGDFANILGIRPDVILHNHRGAIDMATVLPASAVAPCAPDTTAARGTPPQTPATLKIGLNEILTAPPLLPLIRTSSAQAGR